MDWNQIETKWSAMARRIRADVQCGVPDDILVLRHCEAKQPVAGSIAIKDNCPEDIGIPQKRGEVSTS